MSKLKLGEEEKIPSQIQRTVIRKIEEKMTFLSRFRPINKNHNITLFENAVIPPILLAFGKLNWEMIFKRIIKGIAS